ncbi:MAG TPA: YheU family protein [Steroidobacteraceae bacterium]|nr:YheU family protein [Steroidobacteraceae bacterium]
MTEGEALKAVEVPHTELSADLLQAVIESFVLREGTDYGEKELSLQDKVARVIAQLKRGEAKIIFDPESDSVTIVVR